MADPRPGSSRPGDGGIEQRLFQMREVILTREPVELYKVLKFEGFVGSGGEARSMVAAGRVKVNGAVELQKRKQVSTGDVIEVAGDRFQLRLRQDSQQ
jgi:ribosome-associated protein